MEKVESKRDNHLRVWHGDGCESCKTQLEPDVSVMKSVQGSGLRASAQLCSATQTVKCAVALLSPSSLASVSLSFLSWFSLL